MAEIYSFAKSVQGASHIKREQAEEILALEENFHVRILQIVNTLKKESMVIEVHIL